MDFQLMDNLIMTAQVHKPSNLATVPKNINI